ncbi:hypothetical protein AAYQ05_05150 [Flavobacterium sp. B11]|uniref:hypothetical protein n=1 Tax=Flavobacterium movens TaxID=214860 RepID=UPI0031E1D7CA
MRKFVYLLVLLVTVGCADQADLGYGYYYLSEYDAVDIGYPDGAIIYKSSAKNEFDEIIIKETVKNAKSDDNYIIAMQLPKNEKVLRYFIIDKFSGRIFGPLDEKSFNELKIKLGIEINFD